MSDNPVKFDIYAEITANIIKAIEAGAGDWRMPWHVTAGQSVNSPYNASSGRRYRGINTVALWAAARAAGYETGIWATYRQWSELGAQVRKGEKSSLVVFWKALDANDDAEDDEGAGAGARRARMMARGYRVFNVAQVDGWAIPDAIAPASEPAQNARAEAFFRATGADIRNGGNRAYYTSQSDFIQMPPFAAFAESPDYYATLAHEVTHWTGHASRCDRQLGNRFGSDAYAAEELIAELGAAFLCSDIEISSVVRPDHAQYIASWLKVLKGDKRAVFVAAGKAQAAADFLAKLAGDDWRTAAVPVTLPAAPVIAPAVPVTLPAAPLIAAEYRASVARPNGRVYESAWFATREQAAADGFKAVPEAVQLVTYSRAGDLQWSTSAPVPIASGLPEATRAAMHAVAAQWDKRHPQRAGLAGIAVALLERALFDHAKGAPLAAVLREHFTNQLLTNLRRAAGLSGTPTPPRGGRKPAKPAPRKPAAPAPRAPIPVRAPQPAPAATPTSEAPSGASPRLAAGEAFAADLKAAREACRRELGERWYLVAGASQWIAIPARLAAFRSARGTQIHMLRNQRVPVARYWPAGAIPASVTVVPDKARAVHSAAVELARMRHHAITSSLAESRAQTTRVEDLTAARARALANTEMARATWLDQLIEEARTAAQKYAADAARYHAELLAEWTKHGRGAPLPVPPISLPIAA